MKFGKLESIDGVDFSLAPEDPRNASTLANAADTAEAFQVLVGCPVWGNKGWIGKIYPKRAKAGEYLTYYAQSFNTIELNSTHYGMPKAETLLRWKEQAAGGFEFCPKFPQEISHYQKLTGKPERVQLFCERVSLLEEKLGHSFVQLPPTFGPDSFDRLERFVESFPAFVPLAIEFRHPDWFVDRCLMDDAFDLLQGHGVATVITDVAGRRDVSHASLTSEVVLLRFVGNQLDPTDYTRLDDWLERFGRWKDMGVKKVFVFVHEPDDTFAPDIGGHLIEKLNHSFGLSLAQPGIPHDVGGQMRLF